MVPMQYIAIAVVCTLLIGDFGIVAQLSEQITESSKSPFTDSSKATLGAPNSLISEGKRSTDVAHGVREYGVDISFPVHHSVDPKSHFGKRHADMIRGCSSAFSQALCHKSELYRMSRNRAIPSLQTNYTRNGYLKMRAPQTVFDAIRDLFRANR